ncbi:MAG TPA: hypothetical protein VHL34_14100 [Rhizomicrobium sp.]|jgi:DNA-binding response OmpR family regulator|nr:hypothetical protein [Rhizomicrobium sp.]
MSKPAICLFDGATGTLSHIESLLQQCGFDVWHIDNADIRRQLRDHPQTLCVIIDFPGSRGLTLLEMLRYQGIDLPAILIADQGEMLEHGRIAKASVLDILRRPFEPRELLSWIECIVVAQNSLTVARDKKAA